METTFKVKRFLTSYVTDKEVKKVSFVSVNDVINDNLRRTSNAREVIVHD